MQVTTLLAKRIAITFYFCVPMLFLPLLFHETYPNIKDKTPRRAAQTSQPVQWRRKNCVDTWSRSSAWRLRLLQVPFFEIRTNLATRNIVRPIKSNHRSAEIGRFSNYFHHEAAFPACNFLSSSSASLVHHRSIIVPPLVIIFLLFFW